MVEDEVTRDGATQPLPSKNEEGTWIRIADMDIFIAPGKDINKVIEKYLKYLKRKRSGMKLTKYLPNRQKPEKVLYSSYKIHGKNRLD